MAAADPRRVRLQQEHDRLKAWCAERAHAVTLLKAEGSPPTRYELRFLCDSPMDLGANGKHSLSSSQTLHFQLGGNYPFQAPTVIVSTKVVHPNIWTSGQVCLGHYWTAQRSLDQLADMMWRVLVWDHDVTNPDSAANGIAARWYSEHRALAPFDRLDPREPKSEKTADPAEPPAPVQRIVWNSGG